LLPPSTDPTYFTAKEGDIIAGYLFQQDVTDIFATAIPAAKIKIIQPGRLMTVAMPTDSLFFSNEPRLREGKIDFLGRIVTALSTHPNGVRIDLEFTLIGAADRRGFIGAGQTLSRSRADAFARQLSALGAPPDSVSVGLRAGDREGIIIYFYVRDADEFSIMLKKSFERDRR
jgi:outer membrane protein OmpA-like peptidoglycan-associated protein